MVRLLRVEGGTDARRAIFLVALMTYTILATVRDGVRVGKGIPVDEAREIRSLTFWLRLAAVALIVLAYSVWTGVPLVANLLLVLNLGLVVAWLLLIRKASRA